MSNSPELPSAVVVDIDGTIASHEGIRGHHDYARVGEDAPIQAIVRLVQLLAKHHRVIYCSGRAESSRQATEAWLERHGLPGHELLLLRPTGDRRSDEVVKAELYRSSIAPAYCVELVLEDRSRVVRMWRDLGLTCLQVAEGDF